MDFTHISTYSHSFDDVVKANFSEDFIHGLTNIPDVAPPQVTSIDDDGKTVTVTTHWEYTGQLDTAARAILGTKTLTWEQTITVDKETKTGTIHIEYANGKPPGTLKGTITYSEENGTTTRTIDASIVVKILFAGPQIEKRLADAIQARFSAEAEALDAYLNK